MVERFTRVDAETIDYEATITDPTRFTRPWTVRFPLSQDQSARGVAAGELFGSSPVRRAVKCDYILLGL